MKFIEKLLGLTSATTAQLEAVNVNNIQAVSKIAFGENRIEMLSELVYSLIDENDDENANALIFRLTLPVVFPVDILPVDIKQARKLAEELSHSELFFDNEVPVACWEKLVDMDYYDLPTRTETGANVQIAVGEFCHEIGCYELEFDLMQRGCELLNENTVDDAQLIRQQILDAIAIILR